jgi:hypothetical protein
MTCTHICTTILVLLQSTKVCRELDIVGLHPTTAQKLFVAIALRADIQPLSSCLTTEVFDQERKISCSDNEGGANHARDPGS